MRKLALVAALLFVPAGLAVAQDAETIDHVTDDKKHVETGEMRRNLGLCGPTTRTT